MASDKTSLKYIVVLGMLSMLLPFAVDMYLPAMSTMAKHFDVGIGQIQFSLTTYLVGLAIGQFFYGPLSDVYGRKPIIVAGGLAFSLFGFACAYVVTIEQLWVLRFFHGMTAASAGVVINALLRDLFAHHQLARMLALVSLMTNIAPLSAPLIGGWLLYFWGWESIFKLLGLMTGVALLFFIYLIPETLTPEARQRPGFKQLVMNFFSVLSHRQSALLMLISSSAFAGMFAFITSGSFVYIELYHVRPEDFGYYFALNILFMMSINLINSRFIQRVGVYPMLRYGVLVQLVLSLGLITVLWFNGSFVLMVLMVAAYVGSLSLIGANSMAMILSYFPSMSGAAASLLGGLRTTAAALMAAGLASVEMQTAWPMIIAMALCASFGAFGILVMRSHA